MNSYIKTIWVDNNEPSINAYNLNKIEQGIEDVTNNYNILEGYTWGASEVSTFYTSKKAQVLPYPEGIAAVGESSNYALEDHVHPAGVAGTSVSVTNNIATNATYYPLWANSYNTGVVATIYTSNTKLTFNPSTGTFSSTIFTSLSDIKFKTDITPVTNGLEVLEQLNPVEFNWISNGNHSSGFIAQDLEKVLPFLVEIIDNNPDSPDFNSKSINYTGLISYMCNAIKVLNKRVLYLESCIK